MRLHAAAREYARIPVAGLPADPTPDVEVQFAADGSWEAATIVDGAARILIAGPDATDNPPETVVLPLGRTLPVVRLTDNPEIVIRGAGPIDVY